MAAERARCAAGSVPGGAIPFSLSAWAGRVKCWRVLTMPASVVVKCSLDRSTAGPMLSCKAKATFGSAKSDQPFRQPPHANERTIVLRQTANPRGR